MILNVGIVPRLVVPDPDPGGPPPAPLPRLWEWEITSARPTASGAVDYITLEVERDDTQSFAKEGVQRLLLPPATDIGLPPNDVDDDVRAGVGDRPPRLDDPDAAARLLTWLRLRPVGSGSALPLSWLGTNAVAIDQRKTLRDTVVGTAPGTADQVVQLPATSIEESSLALEVTEGGRGFVAWRRVDDLGACGRDDRCFELDAEAGTVTFGDGVRGRRAGGGRTHPHRQAARRRRPCRQPAARQSRRDPAPAPRLRPAGAGDRRRGRGDAAGGRAAHHRRCCATPIAPSRPTTTERSPSRRRASRSGAPRCCRVFGRSSVVSTARAR